MNHVCSCGRWISPQFAASHDRFHQGLTRSQRLFREDLSYKAKPDVSVAIVRQHRKEMRQQARRVRLAVTEVASATPIRPIQPIAPVSPVTSRPSAWQRLLRWVGLEN